ERTSGGRRPHSPGAGDPQTAGARRSKGPRRSLRGWIYARGVDHGPGADRFPAGRPSEDRVQLRCRGSRVWMADADAGGRVSAGRPEPLGDGGVDPRVMGLRLCVFRVSVVLLLHRRGTKDAEMEGRAKVSPA